VQLSLPLSEAAPPEPSPVIFVRHRRARRYILRVLPNGTIRVTLPRWGAKREARAFLEASRPWIAQQQQARQPRQQPSWDDGTRILVDGRDAILRIHSGRRVVGIWQDDCEIGSAAFLAGLSVRQVAERWLRRRADAQLPGQLLGLADAHGVTVPRVSIRNQRSRWGACSPTGTITLNWRLVQLPPFVREYVLIHELMHRREMNHSRRFWRLVTPLCPRHAEARRWLRQEGKALWSESDLH
jgi:predicted metal-dependent hydrolase